MDIINHDWPSLSINIHHHLTSMNHHELVINPQELVTNHGQPHFSQPYPATQLVHHRRSPVTASSPPPDVSGASFLPSLMWSMALSLSCSRWSVVEPVESLSRLGVTCGSNRRSCDNSCGLSWLMTRLLSCTHCWWFLFELQLCWRIISSRVHNVDYLWWFLL